MRKCPKCGSPRIHRSRSRGVVEQIRKAISTRRPHRCHACGWRGWGDETEEPAEPEPVRIQPPPDFKTIDSAVGSAGKKAEPKAAIIDVLVEQPRGKRRRRRTR